MRRNRFEKKRDRRPKDADTLENFDIFKLVKIVFNYQLWNIVKKNRIEYLHIKGLSSPLNLSKGHFFLALLVVLSHKNNQEESLTDEIF